MKPNIMLLVALLLLLVAATTYLSLTSDFTGTDDQATEAISSLDEAYQPWFSSIFEPNESAEVLLFVTQGLVGALGLGFFIYLYGKRGQNA